MSFCAERPAGQCALPFRGQERAFTRSENGPPNNCWLWFCNEGGGINNEAAAILCYAEGVRVVHRKSALAESSRIQNIQYRDPRIDLDVPVRMRIHGVLPASSEYAKPGTIQRGRCRRQNKQRADYLLFKSQSSLHNCHRFKSRLVATRNIAASLPELHLG